MAEMLSQAEIDALLGGGPSSDDVPANTDSSVGSPVPDEETLTSNQVDILGEIGNISMGTAATTLSALLNQRVGITTPVVNLLTWAEIAELYQRPCVGVRIDYTVGLEGTNILILVNRDVKIITNLMMGGDGILSDDDDEALTELDLSAIGEAMNQMIGSASTSLASLTNEKIDIATPKAFEIDFNDEAFPQSFNSDKDDKVAATSFKMQVGNLIDSVIVQALPIEFARKMAEKLQVQFNTQAELAPPPKQQPQYEQQRQAPAAPQQQMAASGAQSMGGAPTMAQMPTQQESRFAPDVNAQPVQFQSFDYETAKQQKENIDILMDVPLEVTVELGKTSKRIKEILEFSPGTIIELDKLAGEPIDILINGKYVAKGEVVVIDENFAIRITSIISSELRV